MRFAQQSPVLVMVACLLLASTPSLAQVAPVAESGCVACHEGIEPIREAGSEMMRQILEIGTARRDPAGCVVCHGGDPQAEDKETAHTGRAFYPDPGSPWINERTCGLCHEEHVRVQWHSLMMTEAGKIQGAAWAFGSLTGYEHRWGNFDVENPKDPTMRIGTETYRKYMEHLKEVEPNVFVDRHEALPTLPDDLSLLEEQPELAVFTYLRSQCLRCHFAVKGRQVRGDYRGMGCSSCHVPYGNEGLYEGGDPSIVKDQPGHMLVHSIQGTREAKVTVHGHEYSGIPVETCTTCHDRGKRIGVSFQGLMETEYKTPYTEDAADQPSLHTKHYLAMEQDVHYQKGMLCQDCHTTLDVHSDGFLAAANLAAVEIECADCHGTPKYYPWELPLGYNDEFDEEPASGPGRGVAKKPLDMVLKGTVFPVQDGYLLTARGNPYSNVVRDGSKVTVHTAGGKDLELEPLKLIAKKNELTEKGRVAMASIDTHMTKMECYACHSSWTPQCYGCHVKIDFSGGKTSFDWLAAGHQHMQPECRAARGEQGFDTNIAGQVSEQRSYLRWEEPALGINGEGRVSPVAPGCQVSATIIGVDGKPILTNHIFRTQANAEGAGSDGQLSIDMSPTQPHTTTATTRDCSSCHESSKALGFGIDGGTAMRPPSTEVVVDIETADKHILPKNTQTQIAAIEGLHADWSQFVNDEGEQTQTVGHHFQLSRPLNAEERAHIDRRGVCLSCHKEIPDQSLAVSLLHHIAEYTGQIPKTPEQHDALVHKIMLFAGWGQLAGAAGAGFFGLAAVGWFVLRRRRKRKSTE